jgi:nitroreductase
MRPDDTTLRRILEAGILAPSAENKHHLRFDTQGAALELLTTDHGTWAERPHRRHLALMALGAVIENMALESRSEGLALGVDLFADKARPALIARLDWSASTLPVDSLQHHLASRHTNRRFYRRGAIGAPALARLAAAAADVPGGSAVWLDAPALRRVALRAIRLAETERFRRRSLHDELFGAVRFEHGWRQPIDEWLAPAALEVEAPMRLPFASMRRWNVMRIANAFGAHHAFGLRAGYLPSAGAPHIGMVRAAAADDDSASIVAGRSFQRLWLAADAEGLALQPMAAATALARQTPGDGWVSTATRDELKRLLAVLAGENGASPCMLFRLGRAAMPSARAGRRPVEDYLLRS